MKKIFRGRLGFLLVLLIIAPIAVPVGYYAYDAYMHSAAVRVKLFDQALGIYENYNSEIGISDGAIKTVHKNLELLGVIERDDSEYDDLAFDEQFVAEYLKTHTEEELLSNIYDFFYTREKRTIANAIHLIPDDKNIHVDWDGPVPLDRCVCQKSSTALLNVIDAIDPTIVSFSPELKGTTGYYTENVSAWPQAETEIKSDKRTYHTVTHFGDFAIARTHGQHIVGEFLGWKDGKFIDSQGHWESYSQAPELYYKGTIIFRGEENESVDAFASRAADLGKILIVGENQVYAMTEEAHTKADYKGEPDVPADFCHSYYMLTRCD